jgi:hypothetical protein
MAKLTAWLVTLLGLVLLVVALGWANIDDTWVLWISALAVLIIGIGKLSRNYSKKRK